MRRAGGHQCGRSREVATGGRAQANGARRGSSIAGQFGLPSAPAPLCR
jgi:hypothetical protein